MVAGPDSDSAGPTRFPRVSDVVQNDESLTLSNESLTLSIGDPHLVIVHHVFRST